MKRITALAVIAFVMVVILSCVGSPASGRPESIPTASTATLWVSNAAGAPGELFGVLGSGFPQLETVELYIAGDLWASASTTNNGTFMMYEEEWPSLPVDEIYALEAFVGDELWATHPCATGQ